MKTGFIVCIGLLFAGFAVTVVSQEIIVNGTFDGGAIVTIDGIHRVLRVDKPSPEGIVLIDSNDEGVKMNVAGEERFYEIDKGIPQQTSAPQKAIVRIPSSGGGHYRTPGRINGIAVDFMVDTGATIIAMNLADAKRLGINYRAGEPIPISTANGVINAYKVVLNRVSVGTVEIQNVEAAVSIGDFPQEILLGNSYLSRVDMRRESGVLVLEAKY